ncbi:CBS domain [Macleaya cordata]|uniref:CBS domain n=1 Tax=Macleaya cordata TaxID=56857 RepID=A0A200R7Q1_MACCD|nr:CBS domain [Macleaya cordata]
MQGIARAMRSRQDMFKHGILRRSCLADMVTARARVCVTSSTASWQHKGLENTTVAEVLKTKGEEKDGSLFCCHTNDTVYDAVQLMTRNNIGSLVVLKPGEQNLIAGIITERADYLRKIIVQGRHSKQTKVGEIMTEENKLITVNSDTNIMKAMQLMTDNHIRHVPVIDAKIFGLISIVDVVRAVVEQQNAETISKRLYNYIMPAVVKLSYCKLLYAIVSAVWTDQVIKTVLDVYVAWSVQLSSGTFHGEIHNTLGWDAKYEEMQITLTVGCLSGSKFCRNLLPEMETVKEDEEYSWREVELPCLIPKVGEPELERETGERRRGRHILIAMDHGPNSKHAFDWALLHLCRLADTICLVHAVSNVQNEIVYEMTQGLMEKLAVEALQVAMVKTVARIVEGDAGKVICKEADRLKPAAVVMGTRGRSLIQSVLQGSVSKYCFHNCKSAPVIIVPGKEAGEESVI